MQKNLWQLENFSGCHGYLLLFFKIFNHHRSKILTSSGWKNSYMGVYDLDEYFRLECKFGWNFIQKTRMVENTVGHFCMNPFLAEIWSKRTFLMGYPQFSFYHFLEDEKTVFFGSINQKNQGRYSIIFPWNRFTSFLNGCIGAMNV